MTQSIKLNISQIRSDDKYFNDKQNETKEYGYSRCKKKKSLVELLSLVKTFHIFQQKLNKDYIF